MSRFEINKKETKANPITHFSVQTLTQNQFEGLQNSKLNSGRNFERSDDNRSKQVKQLSQVLLKKFSFKMNLTNIRTVF